MSARAPAVACRDDLRGPRGWQAEWDWHEFLSGEFAQPYFRDLQARLGRERARHSVFPAEEETFAAFAATPLREVRAVILGQDPYVQPGQAHGLSFSVRGLERLPPSLRNIFRELRDDAGIERGGRGDLTDWARQGVLLLNTVLTVRAGESQSHRGWGWEPFSERVLEVVSERTAFCVFLLWGRSAAAKGARIDGRHAVLPAAHPSPLSARRGFFGCRAFSRCNRALIAQGRSPIAW